MEFGYMGLSYREADLSVRDLVYFTDSKKLDFYHAIESTGIEQCMILATCNRSQVFFFYQEEEQLTALCEVYQACFPEVELDTYLKLTSGRDAMEYLYRVTAGMESQVLGEDQILGQVKDALDFARTMGYSHKELSKVVRDAITCAKRIKTALKISEIPLSVGYVGICQLNQKCGIKDKKVLLAGSGKTATLALTYVMEMGASKVTVCSKTLSHAVELREKYPELLVVEYDKRYEVMKDCDIVISATSSPHYVFRCKDAVITHDMWLLDLASPRDIDQNFQQEKYCELINLDSLACIVEENKREREALTEQGQQMIEQDLAETLSWLHTSRVDDTIESLQMRCQEIEQDSFEYLNRKMELSKREQKILAKTLHAALHRLIREPIGELKQLDSREKQDEYKRVLEDLFHI